MLRRSLAALVLVAVVVLAAGSGCNTVRGVGKDVEAGGKAIQRGSGK
ncbi:MAG TPA: entericidin A/B family lipoprotein [Candidatus Hydrogenedentes bacterium]|nr:entericidin A/B family lipoprotein [Candidatus Hydrogenedentota bacterium]